MENPNISRTEILNCPNCGAAVVANGSACAYCGSLYARICSICFNAVTKNMNHCPKCGAAVMETQRAPQKKLKCPVCANALETHEDGNHPFYACPKCGGLWLDHHSLQLVCYRVEKQALADGFKLPDLNPPATGKPRRPYIPCPECGVIMNPKQFAKGSGIIIDCCRKHGNWFDWQELHQVVEYIRKGGMSKSLELERKQALEEARKGQSRRLSDDSALDWYLRKC